MDDSTLAFPELAPAPRRRPSGDQARRLLTGAPRAVLDRLTEGDPLRVRAMVGARLRARWLLLDADRVHLRALALIARAGVTWSGRPGLDPWLAERVNDAIDEVRREGAGRDDPPGACEHLGVPLGLDPEGARAAQIAFDRRDEPQRRAFVRLVLDRESLDRIARDEGVSGSEIGRRARAVLEAVLEAVLTAVDPEPKSKTDPREES